MNGIIVWMVMGAIGFPAAIIGAAYGYAFPWHALGIAALIFGPFIAWIMAGTAAIHRQVDEANRRFNARLVAHEPARDRRTVLASLDPDYRPGASVEPVPRAAVQPPRVPAWWSAVPAEGGFRRG